MNRALRRLVAALAAAWLILLVALSNAQLIAGPGYRSDPRNVRLVYDRLGSERGPIITSDGQLIAFSEQDPDNRRLFRRRYPGADLYGHIVGYTSYLFSDSGLERAASDTLRSDRNATLSGLLDILTGTDIRALGLRLTIDHHIQEAAAAALDGQRGAIVALDPATGAVLAMVSSPGFDPNTILGPADGAAGRSLEGNAGRPLLNRAIQAAYAPGSVFKVVTAAAALDAGLVEADTSVADRAELELPGTTAVIRNAGGRLCAGNEEVSITIAFARSCNTVFASLGIDLGAHLQATAEAFGFGTPPPFDLDVLPSIISAGTDLADGAARAQTAIGHRDLQATPLQMALVAAAVANGGAMMRPYLVEDTFDADGRVVMSTAPEVWRRPLDAATAQILTGMMELAVAEGTGFAASLPGTPVAGKTGTAAPDATVWFIGFAPADDPVIALAVVVEDGGKLGLRGSGGSVAAPIAQNVFAAALLR